MIWKYFAKKNEVHSRNLLLYLAVLRFCKILM